MTRCFAVLLALSVSLYSTPLKADSYSSEDQDVFVEDPSAVPEDRSCQVSPESEGASSGVFTNESVSENPEPVQEQEVYTDNGNYTDVSPENTEQTKRVRTKYWQNILLAVAVVAVAITAMLLVHSHQGHKSHN